MSPRVPIRLLTVILLIVALAEAIALRMGSSLALYALAAAAVGGFLAFWLRITRQALADGPASPWAARAAARLATHSRSRYVYPGLQEAPVPASARGARLRRVADAAKGLAIMFLVVTATMVARTVVALEILH